jgi:chaperonin GroES
MTIKPLRDKIIVKPAPIEDVSKGGIIIPDAAKDAPTRGEVVAAGSGILVGDGTIIPLEIVEGNEVLYRKNTATEIEVDGEKYVILREMDVLAVMS